MKIEVERREPWTILALAGELDRTSGPDVYVQFQRELIQGHIQVVFDLGRVRFVDSFGLGVLVRCYRDVRMRGGEIFLREVPAPIRRILEFTRLDSILRTAPGAVGWTGTVRGGEPEQRAA